MQRRFQVIAGAALVGCVALGTGIAAAAGGDDDDEQPIAEANRYRVEAAALEHTGGGRVTETEQADEDSFYEVEVTLEDGRHVGVQLGRKT